MIYERIAALEEEKEKEEEEKKEEEEEVMCINTVHVTNTFSSRFIFSTSPITS